MTQQKSIKKLSKFLSYVLGRNPYEFGIVADDDGFVKIKELIKAVCEEKEWKYVRKKHINEIIYTLPSPLIEVKEDKIRSINRDKLPNIFDNKKLPKLLYACVRSKAHAFVLENGITPSKYKQIIMSSDLNMAVRIGKRIDASPVLLTIIVEKAVNKGVLFKQAGETIFLTENIPVGCFTGPPLPKKKEEHVKLNIPKEQKPAQPPGGFFIDLSIDKEKIDKEKKKKFQLKKKKNDMIRKKQKKSARQRKQQMWDKY